MPPAKKAPADFVPDERQRQAIEHVAGSMLVVAGAGTGKTTILTQRIARLVREGHARPDEVLALTYADNAAAEMQERVQAELKGTDTAKLQTSTFHAYCNNLLRRTGNHFKVLDDADLWIYLRKHVRDLKLKHFTRAANTTQFLDDLLDFIRRCHDELVGPEQYRDYVARLERDQMLPLPRVTKSKDIGNITRDEVLDRCREIACVFDKVEEMLRAHNLGTFGHMITRAYELLKRDVSLLTWEQARARFMLVDEFQDVNFAQVKVLSLLAGGERNVFGVGDPDQAIYRFRGASSAAFGLFLRQFPDAKLVVLEKNRRSVTPILRCAHAVIRENPPAFDSKRTPGLTYQRSPLLSARDESAVAAGTLPRNQPVEIVTNLPKALEIEAADVGQSIAELKRTRRCKWADFAVIYRSHGNRDEVANDLGERSIPFTIENLDVRDTPEVRDLLACLTAVVRPEDGASLLRVAALPQFSVAPDEFRAALRASDRRQRESQPKKLTSALQAAAGADAVLRTLDQARQEIADHKLKTSGALELVVRMFALPAESPAIQAVRQFISAWEQKAEALIGNGCLPDFLEYMDDFRDAKNAVIQLKSDETIDAVRLMTAHAAKGLEFDHVFVIRINPATFPQNYREPLFEFPQPLRDPDSVAAQDDKTLNGEEERRLFYVAMTRARDTLALYSQPRGKNKVPSGFLGALLSDRSAAPFLKRREAKPFQVELFAGAAPPPATNSRLGEWLKLPPAGPLHTRLSASAIDSYDRCPLRFKLARDWHVPEEASGALQYGAAVHTVLRAYFEGIRLEKPLSSEQAIEFFRTTLADARLDDAYQHQLYEAQGILQLADFLEIHRGKALPKVLQAETSFEVKMGSITVSGRIDRVDDLGGGRVAVVDYKTGKPKSEDDANDSLQLSIYALAAREVWGYQVDQLSFYNLDGNRAVSTTRTEHQLQGAKAKVQEVSESIERGEFDPTAGYHCRYCPYRQLCPETERAVHPSSAAPGGGHSN